jgi:hypothetical protein
MARKFIDCREFPSEMNCTIAISAESEKELRLLAPGIPFPCARLPVSEAGPGIDVLP